jgi:hypothetical protein
MSDLSQLFVATAAAVGLLTLISLWTPRRLAVKGTALATGVLLLPLSYASLVDLLSRPKPIDLEWWQAHAKEATVLGSQMHEGEGIYLWLQLPDVAEPRGYVLPWSRQTAEQLQQARRDAEQQQGGEVHMRMPFEPSLEKREPMFYAQPQPAPPPKDLVDQPPQYFRPPGQDA